MSAPTSSKPGYWWTSNYSCPPATQSTWAGQYQYMQRAKAKLLYVVPLTLGIIIVLLLIHFRRISDVVLILGSLPFALVGSIWLMYWQEFNFSIAVAVGFIALAGVAVEIGVLMLVYLNQAWRDQQEQALRDGPRTGS